VFLVCHILALYIYHHNLVRLQVLMVDSIKKAVFWVVASFSPEQFTDVQKCLSPLSSMR
jgi:hypothetical protein